MITTVARGNIIRNIKERTGSFRASATKILRLKLHKNQFLPSFQKHTPDTIFRGE
jgi:hypothetical protein